MARARGGRRGPVPYDPSRKRGPERGLALAALVFAAVVAPFVLARSIIFLQPAQGIGLLALFALAVLMALPLNERAIKTRVMLWALASYMALDILWADYVALELPFFPFITPVRILLLLLVGIWLFFAATSRDIHGRLWLSMREVPLLTAAVVACVIFDGLSIIFSLDPGLSSKSFFNHLLTYTIPFFMAATLVRSRRDIDILVGTLVLCAGVVGLIVVAETIIHRNLYAITFSKWINHETIWLKDIFVGEVRRGKYRAFGPFDIHLSLADYFVLCLPFVYYCFEQAKRAWAKLLLAGIALLSFYGIYATDSRTAMLASLLITGIYAAVKCLQFQARSQGSLLRPLVALLMVGTILATPIVVAIGFSNMGWEDAFGAGGTRSVQLKLGLPKVAKRPITGYGAGLAGYVLNYRADGVNLTIDNYYLSVALDCGILAALAFALLPATMMFIAFRRALARSRDGPLFLAFALSALAFAIVRSTLSQYENINLFYILLGTFVALLLMVKEESAPAAEQAVAEKSVRNPPRRRRIVGDDRWRGSGTFLSSFREPR
jgi:hypothetical protein